MLVIIWGSTCEVRLEPMVNAMFQNKAISSNPLSKKLNVAKQNKTNNNKKDISSNPLCKKTYCYETWKYQRLSYWWFYGSIDKVPQTFRFHQGTSSLQCHKLWNTSFMLDDLLNYKFFTLEMSSAKYQPFN